MKFKIDDLFGGLCTADQYYSQFKTARTLKVGSTYLQPNIAKWAQTSYKILFNDGIIAIGVEVNKNLKIIDNQVIPHYCLFYSSGVKAGWRYQDTRSCYRLIEEL